MVLGGKRKKKKGYRPRGRYLAYPSIRTKRVKYAQLFSLTVTPPYVHFIKGNKHMKHTSPEAGTRLRFFFRTHNTRGRSFVDLLDGWDLNTRFHVMHLLLS
jgi:hypothetical protein